MKKTSQTALLASTAFALVLAFSAPQAYASENAKLELLEKQLIALQKEVSALKAAKAEADAKAAAAPQAATAAAPAASGGSVGDKVQASIEKSTGVKVSLGGFFDATAAFRSKNQGTDVGSNWNASIPFDNHVNSKQQEFRASARNTRLGLAASANPDAATALGAYVEMDFAGTSVNSSPAQSNNYSPRFRQGWAQYERNDWGLHVLAGQAWSMASQTSVGITARKEVMPIVPDAGQVPGSVWTRSPQLRIVKDFADKKVWAGLSFEAPSTIYAVSSTATAYGANAGTSTGISGGTVTSNDIAPDVIAKVAFDPGFGHYEVFGMGRTFHDRYQGGDNTAFGLGGGASVLFKTLDGKLDLSANFLGGRGVGRYGTAQLPDVVFTPTGDIRPTTSYAALVGAIARPTPTWDIFAYAGLEQINRESYGGDSTTTGIGYGSAALDTSTCYAAESSTACKAQTHRVWQVTGGFWNSLYKGDYGKVQLGLQHSLTRRDAFSGATGLAPHAFENVTLMSFRFTPTF